MWAHTYNESDEDVKPGLAPLLWVWVLVDECEQTLWKKIAEIPSDMQRWLIPLRLHEFDDVQIHTSFSDEHLLIYSWVPEEGRAYRFVLFNVVTTMWEKVEVPNHSVSIKADKEKDTKKWDFPKDLFSMELDDDFIGASRMGQGKSARGKRNCSTGLTVGIGYDCDDKYVRYDNYDMYENRGKFGEHNEFGEFEEYDKNHKWYMCDEWRLLGTWL